MRKIRVLHILNSDGYSGAEKVVISIINNLKDEIDFAYQSRDGKIRSVLSENNILFYPVSRTSPDALRKTIHCFQPDIIHAHDFTAGIAAALSFTKIPIINHLHNDSPWLQKYGIKSFGYKMCTDRFKKILTVSDSVMDEYVFGDKLREKTITVGNPVDLNRVRELADMEDGFGAQKFHKEYDIVFFGRETTQKDPLRFLKIVRKVKDCLLNSESVQNRKLKVILIGDGELKSEINTEIKKLGLTENVICTGFQTNPYQYLKKARVMVMPSLWEGFGLAAVEGLCLGVPVVASPVGGLKDIVNDSCGKLCVTDTDFVNEILRLLEDNEYYQMKSDAAVVRANDFDNMNAYMDTIRQIYKEVLNIK